MHSRCQFPLPFYRGSRTSTHARTLVKVVGACEWNLQGCSVVQYSAAGVVCGLWVESSNYLHGRNLSDQWRGATRVRGRSQDQGPMTQSGREQKAAPPGRGSHVPGADETKLRSPLFFFLPRFVRGRLCTPLNGSTVVLMTDCMSSERASETNVLSCGLWLAIPCTPPILILALFATYNTTYYSKDKLCQMLRLINWFFTVYFFGTKYSAIKNHKKNKKQQQ